MIKAANLTGSISRNAGGLFESVRRLVQSLMETGMEVRVFGTQDAFSATDVDAWKPVPVSAFRPVWLKKFGYSPRFAGELEAFTPDLTHTHGLWLYPSVATNHYCRKRGIPYLISAHGMLDPWAMRNSHWKKMAAYLLYEGSHLRRAHCLRALCEPEARSMRQLRLANPIAIIPNGIDLPCLDDGGETRRDGPLGTLKAEGRKVALFLSRIHPKKGLVNLLKGWALATKDQARTAHWLLAIAGWDQAGHEDELKRLATELGLKWGDLRDLRGLPGAASASVPQASACSLLFLGPQFGEAKAACYRDCDAFVLPSFSEGVPMVVLEAWAWRKPVLMTPQCNLPEGFAVGAAIRIEPSPGSIARGLQDMFQAPNGALLAMGKRGRDFAASRYTWPRLADEMKRVYEWMLGGGAKPACLAGF